MLAGWQVMLQNEQRKIIEELYHIQNCELALASLYQELTMKFPEERFFWEEAVADEINHARQIGRLIALTSSNLKRYSPGRFKIELLKTYLERVYNHIMMIQNGQMNRKEILLIVLDYEKAEIETNPWEVVKSYENEYTDFAYTFEDDIKLHTARIVSYVKDKLAQYGVGAKR
jgi:hypothetical protein